MNNNSKSDFSRNILTLMTGTTIAQAIPIAISPILTRIYTPEDFGVYAVFFAITTTFGSIANARYEIAIMLPKKDGDAINLLAIGLAITSTISFILLILVILLNDFFTKLLNNDAISLWLYFIPIAVFFTGIFNLLNYFNNRKKYYKDMAKATIIKSIILALTQLSIGFFKQGVTGLISGQLLSQIFANIQLFRNIIKDNLLLSKISKIKMIALAKKYKDFPKFSVWATLANTLSVQLTNILISTFFSIITLGFYSLVQKVLAIPSTLIGNSISQVFFQEATKEKQKTGATTKTFNNTIKKLIIISLPSFGLMYLIIEDLFVFVFGEEWKVAGIYAQILLPLFFMRFISSPLAIITSIFEKQIQHLIINIILIFSSMLIISVSHYMQSSFENFLFYFSILMGFNYFIFIFYYYKLSKGNR